MNIFNSKRAEGNVGTAIAVVISVVLGGLILLGTIALIDGQVGPALGKTLDLQGNQEITNVVDFQYSDATTYKIGDLNHDGKVNHSDVDLLNRYLSGWNSYTSITKEELDINFDGRVNEYDMEMLKLQVESDSNTNVINGGFEFAYAGTSPYGWKLKSIGNNTAFVTNDYTKAFTFNTLQESEENKVVELDKIGAGYVVMESMPISVVGGQEYYLSFDYMTTDIRHTPKPVCDRAACASGCNFVNHWMGIVTKIRQYDAYGNLLDANGKPTVNETYSQPIYIKNMDLGLGNKEMSDFERACFNVKLFENTASVSIYIGFGTYGAQSEATVLFDNVDFTQVEDTGLFNGNFESVTYLADGGRPVGVPGPAGWTNFGIKQEQKTHSGYEGFNVRYQSTIVSEKANSETGEVNHYLEFQLTDERKAAGKVKGYCVASSNQIAVTPGDKFNVSFLYKSYGDNRPTNPATLSAIFYDANGNIVNSSQRAVMGTDKVEDWTQFSFSATAPEGSAYYRLCLYQGTNKASLYVDAVYCLDEVVITYSE